MAINTSHHNGGVLIFSGEFILLYCDNIEAKFEEVNRDVRFIGCKKGRIYLTTHRMIFNNWNANDKMQSLTFPFFQLSNVSLEQPTFGCNYIKGKLRNQPIPPDLHMNDQIWVGTCKFRLYFPNGGAIDFGMALLQAAKMASANANREPPPPYVPPIPPYCPAGHDAYMPPQGTFGMVLPTHIFTSYPQCNSVWTAGQPPPYAGICTSPPTPYGPCPPPVRHVNAPHSGRYHYQYQACAGADAPQPVGDSTADAKAREAGSQEAYYNPSNPHMAYMQQPQAPAYAQAPPYSPPNAQPPSYDEAMKKMQ